MTSSLTFISIKLATYCNLEDFILLPLSCNRFDFLLFYEKIQMSYTQITTALLFFHLDLLMLMNGKILFQLINEFLHFWEEYQKQKEYSMLKNINLMIFLHRFLSCVIVYLIEKNALFAKLSQTIYFLIPVSFEKFFFTANKYME